MTIRVDRATSKDFAELLASADALIATDAARYDPEATNLDWAAQAGTAYCTELLAGGASLALLARDGDQVVGHLVGRLAGPGTVHPIRIAELESIHVYPEHRGSGVGHQLMAAFRAWAAENGATRCTVTSYAANHGAQRFYVRHGFVPMSVIYDLVDVSPTAGGLDPHSA